MQAAHMPADRSPPLALLFDWDNICHGPLRVSGKMRHFVRYDM